MAAAATGTLTASVLCALDDLRPHPRNPRRISRARLDHLKRVLSADPQMLEARPLIALPDGTVIAGNQRLAAAVELRDEGDSRFHAIPVYRADLDEDRALEWALRDNEAFGERDDLLTAEILEELSRRGRELDLTGMTRASVEKLLRDHRQTSPLDAEPTARKGRAKSKLGEVYELGPHRIMCGDSTDVDQVLALMGDDRADCVWTDPPYAIYGSSSGLSSSVTDDKIVRPFFRDTLSACEAATALFAPVFVCCDWRSWPSWWEMAKATAIEPKNLLVWDKGGAGLGNNFANTYELVGYFIHAAEQKVMTQQRKAGIRPILAPNIIRANRVPAGEREHNAAKPVGLIAELLDLATKKGQLVLDLFAGSGSTLIAAESLGRRCVLMEIDPLYVDVVRQRYADYTDQPDLAP